VTIASSDDRRTVPTGAVVADLFVLLLLIVGLIVAYVGPTPQAYFAGVRWSISSPERAMLLAAVIAAVRHWRVPHHPRLRRLFSHVKFQESAGLAAAGSAAPGRRLGEFAIVTIGFAALVAAVTWPQAVDLHSVPDKGDPLFSTWRISWIAHQLVRDPIRLFDGNIFHPEVLTLTYSDPVIVPGLMSAPFIWLGAHQLSVYTLLLLSGFALSGVATYYLVRELTGRRDAAAIAGVVFAICPFRFEHYSHLEMQMTMWMPLVLLGLHRTMTSGRLGDGVATGVAFGLQTLSSLYYGCYLAVYVLPVALVLWIARGRPMAPVRALAAGALVAAIMAAPVGLQFVRNKPMLGERPDSDVRLYSATAGDYFEPHIRSRLYGAWSPGGLPERQLFTGFAPIVLAVVALWPPFTAARFAYGVGLAVAVDGSLGFNGMIFEGLREWVPPFRGLRVPARFAIIVSFTLAVLSGFGVASILRRWPNWRPAIFAAILAIVVIESMPRLELEQVAAQPPDIYRTLDPEAPVVLAEIPVGANDWGVHFDAQYIYFATFHWQRLVNGNSGFFPPSYQEFIERVRSFPSTNSIAYLRSRGVQYFSIHGEFMSEGKLRRTIRDLRRRPGIELVDSAHWESAESRLYRLDPVESPTP
jgi:hypothetical protein